jgi:signal transduction histidine kinase
MRVSPAGPTELVEAGEAFNAMADRVVALLAAERELLADLSHRLRTPLTALRLDAESIGSGPAAQRVRQAAGQLEQEVDGIIQAARSPDGEGTGGRCDAAEVVRARMRFWSALAADQQRPCEVAGADGPVPVPLPRTSLVAVVDALVGNVFRYTPPGCGFALSLQPVDDGTCLVVEDAGPGIRDPEAAVRRGTSGAGSTGLGLDIARRAAESTGGSIAISRGALGGARVWLRFGPVPAGPGGASARGAHRRLLPPIRHRHPRSPRQVADEST